MCSLNVQFELLFGVPKKNYRMFFVQYFDAVPRAQRLEEKKNAISSKNEDNLKSVFLSLLAQFECAV